MLDAVANDVAFHNGDNWMDAGNLLLNDPHGNSLSKADAGQ